MDNAHKPSIFKILTTDYLSMLCVMFPIVSGLMLAALMSGINLRGKRGQIIGADATPFFQILVLVEMLIFVPLLIWRVRRIFHLFKVGEHIVAVITHWSCRGTRGRVDYEYHFNGEIYRGGCAFIYKEGMLNPEADKQRPASHINIYIDPIYPKRSIVPAFYWSE